MDGRGVSTFSTADSTEPSLAWVESMGGPLIAVPVSALARWHGCTQSGMTDGSGEVLDDYDRACEVEGLAGVISVGGQGDQGLVLADEPARSCYLPEHRAFVRWLGADSETNLIAAAHRVLADPATPWEECGTWTTDGPAVLIDSVTAGTELGVEYPNGGGLPEQARVPLQPGSWTVRAVHAWTIDRTSVGVIRLQPTASS
jgi:hypothetical protein